jgi:putative ABC transport system permease protein
MRYITFFLHLLTWLSVRQMRMHPWRVLAVLFGIALGAAVFTSVRLAVDASLDSFTQSVDLISGKADWTVLEPGGRVPERLVARLRSHPAVKTASPLLTSYVSIFKENMEPFLLIGLDPTLDRPLRNWQVDPSSERTAEPWLDLMREPNTIFLSQHLAQKQVLETGDITELEHVHQVTHFQILGVLEEQGLSLVEGGHVALTDIATMQEFTGLQGWVDRIDLRLKPEASAKELKQLQGLLPPGVVVEGPGETKKTGQTMIRAYQLNLSVLSFVSLFVGMFLVYSLVSLNAASRRRELAILRSLGASSRLVFVLVLSEGLLLGVLGWVLAIPVGSFFVKYVLEGVSHTISTLFVRVRIDALHLEVWEIMISFLMTLFVSLLAA